MRILLDSHCPSSGSQDPGGGGGPPPGPGDPPPGGGESGGAGGVLTGGGGGINGDKERIFPNLPTWKSDLTRRCVIMNRSIEIQQTDDEETRKQKLAAQASMREISLRLDDRKLMENRNQRVIANQLADIEEKLSSTGRQLFGINWNTIPCGAGFSQANCGALLPCTPPQGKKRRKRNLAPKDPSTTHMVW